jgi:hypothetical protein
VRLSRKGFVDGREQEPEKGEAIEKDGTISVEGLAALKISKYSQGKSAQIFSPEPGNFSEQELNPYATEETQHPFSAGKDFISQVFILKRLKRRGLDLSTKLSFAVILKGSAIKIRHVMATRYNSPGPLTGFDPFQTPLRQATTSLRPISFLLFRLIRLSFHN